LKVLVACEFSGVVRDAFIARGHDAWSCDILPDEKPGPHFIGDVLPVLGRGWDLIIVHPPCTYLHWNGRRPGRAKLTAAALDFVRAIFAAPVPRLALENPVGCISSQIRRPDQIVQPFMFGHPESKKTCLWLRGLPPLVSTKLLPLPVSGRWENQTKSGQNKLPPSPDRWKERSRTYPGLAAAMAEQWG